MINLIDVGIGNLISIENWLANSGHRSSRVHRVEEFQPGPIILPGVGSAPEYMTRLNNDGLSSEICNRANNGGIVIGICLGFQIMTDYSHEAQGTNCLGLLKGECNYLRTLNMTREVHNGWMPFSFDQREYSDFCALNNVENRLPIKRKKKVSGRVFMNHSLGVVLSEGETIYAKDLPNTNISYMAIKENLIGIQFHPEKSQETGRILADLLL